MGVPETVGVEADLFHIVEEERVSSIFVEKRTKIIVAECPLGHELWKQPGCVPFSVPTIVTPAIGKRLISTWATESWRKIATLAATSIARIAKVAPGNRSFSSNGSTSPTRRTALRLAAFVPSVICTGVSGPLYLSRARLAKVSPFGICGRSAHVG